MRCCSTTSRNSLASGSGLSRAMICRHSLSGRPDFTPRTMTSMALANSDDELALARLVSLPRNQRGRPNSADEAPRQASISGGDRRAEMHSGASTARRRSTLGDPESLAASCRDRRARAAGAARPSPWPSGGSRFPSACRRRASCGSPRLRWRSGCTPRGGFGLFSVTSGDALVLAPLAGNVGIDHSEDDAGRRTSATMAAMISCLMSASTIVLSQRVAVGVARLPTRPAPRARRSVSP